MANREKEFPVPGEHLPVPEEFPQPLPQTEFRLPDARAEDSAPPGTDFRNPDEAMEFHPPGSDRGEEGPSSLRKRRLRKLLYGVAALVMLGLLYGTGRTVPSETAVTSPAGPAQGSVSDLSQTPYTSSSDIPLPTAVPTPEPLGKKPVIDVDFFFFSHEHYALVHMSNTDALHSVRVRVVEKELEKTVYEHYLEESEIASGLFEMPMLSTGDYYMENMAALDAANAWPAFELTLDAWYENEAGDGEDSLTITLEPEFELGFGVSYMRPDQTWSEAVPPDSFYVVPWEEIEDIRYVINDPASVTDPMTVSVDLSFNGRHAAPEEYEEVVEVDEYNLVDSSGVSSPHVGYTKELVLRRPDWMPEEGTLHVHIVQYLASTGKQWVRDYDIEYPQRYDWEG